MIVSRSTRCSCRPSGIFDSRTFLAVEKRRAQNHCVTLLLRIHFMRYALLSISILALTACVDANRPTSVTTTDRAGRLAFTQNTVDTIGLPDLSVDSKATQNNWLTSVED